MTPGKFDLTIYRGDSYRFRFTLWADTEQNIPADLTGTTAKAEIRTAAGGTVLGEMALTITLPNRIDGVLTAATTTAIGTKGGAWDLQLKSGEDVKTVLAGKVKVTADVTDSGGMRRANR